MRWQLAKRQAGTHKTLGRSEINRTKKKIYKQKGTGGARHGARRAPQFRGGGRAFGPVVRSHAHDLPKKVRALGLKHALSAKAKEQQLIVVDERAIDRGQDQGAARAASASCGLANVADHRRRRGRTRTSRCAARNIPNIDVLPVQGINVYDILRREKLVLTKAAVEALEARFK